MRGEREIRPGEAAVAVGSYLLVIGLFIRWVNHLETEAKEKRREVLIFQENHVPRSSYEELLSVTEPLTVTTENR